MTKDQIKAELRRSALEDRNPFIGVNNTAFIEAAWWRYRPKSDKKKEHMSELKTEDLRMFFLIVAEAI